MLSAQVMANAVATGFGGASGYQEMNVDKPLHIKNVMFPINLLTGGCANFQKLMIVGCEPLRPIRMLLQPYSPLANPRSPGKNANMENTLGLLLSSVLAGLLGAAVMDFFLLLASKDTKPKVDMTEALGSLLTGRLEGATALGRAIHLLSGVAFGVIYGLIMLSAQATALPYSLFLGLGLGLFQGIFVSYCLMFVVAERHPIKKYRDATLQTGALHLIGHLVFGGIAGLIIGLLYG